MATHSDDIIELARRSGRDATILAGRDHSPDEFKLLLTRMGSSLELFFKDHVYVNTRNSLSFERLIDGLEAAGVSTQSRDALHDLRRAYNKAKHDASYEAPLQPIMNIFGAVVSSLEEISRLRLGNTQQTAGKAVRRLLWFAAWDHFIGGDTEISIFLPTPPEVDMPWGFETIYIDISSWEIVKSELSDVGRLCIGENCVPKRAYEFWSGGDDFLAAGSFEGNLRDMILVLARHERVEDILPELKRENEQHSMRASALFASTDLSQSDLADSDRAALEEAIIRVAGARYGAPGTSKCLKRYAAIVSDLISNLPLETRRNLSGPLFVSPVRYAELEADAILQAAEKNIMIVNDGRLVAKM
jgi:hypothetical protein